MTTDLEEKLQLIQSIFNSRRFKSTRMVISALFYCLSLDELVEIYIYLLNSKSRNIDFRKNLEKQIIAKMENTTEGIANPSIEKLFSCLQPFNTQKSMYVNTLLYNMHSFLPKNFLKRYFYMLLDSHRSNDHYRAFKISHLIWSSDIEKILLETWLRNKDEECLNVIIDKCKIENLKEIFDTVWLNNYSGKIKIKVLKRLLKTYPEIINNLMVTHPITYLYCCVLIGKNIDENQAYQLAIAAKDINELRVALWCLGRSRNWNAIIKLNNLIPKKEEEFEQIEKREFLFVI